MEREASIDDRPDLIQNEVESSYWADPQPNIHPEEMTVPLNDDPYDNDDYDNDYDNDNDGYDYGSDEPPLPDHPNTLPIGDDLVPIFRAQNHLDGLLFTRRAKKVDVQELKRVLWQEIESLTKKRKQPDMTFSSLVNKLDESGLSREMLKDVSVPYCFICLLHLANEHNLELKSNNSGELLILSS